MIDQRTPPDVGCFSVFEEEGKPFKNGGTRHTCWRRPGHTGPCKCARCPQTWPNPSEQKVEA